LTAATNFGLGRTVSPEYHKVRHKHSGYSRRSALC
jgi:hypothetical protein